MSRPSHRADGPSWSTPPAQGWLRWYLARPRRRVFDPIRVGSSPVFLAPLFGGALAIGGFTGLVSERPGSWLADLTALVVGLVMVGGWATYLCRPATIKPAPSLADDIRAGVRWLKRRRRQRLDG